MSEQMDAVLRRLGYVRANTSTIRQNLETRADTDNDVEAAAYPQVIVVQGRSAGESWVRDHAGQLLLAAGVGVFGLAALAVVALVAIVTAVAMVGMAVGVAVIGGVAAASQAGRGRR
jgi:hypothetical protein